MLVATPITKTTPKMLMMRMLDILIKKALESSGLVGPVLILTGRMLPHLCPGAGFKACEGHSTTPSIPQAFLSILKETLSSRPQATPLRNSKPNLTASTPHLRLKLPPPGKRHLSYQPQKLKLRALLQYSPLSLSP